MKASFFVVFSVLALVSYSLDAEVIPMNTTITAVTDYSIKIYSDSSEEPTHLELRLDSEFQLAPSGALTTCKLVYGSTTEFLDLPYDETDPQPNQCGVGNSNNVSVVLSKPPQQDYTIVFGDVENPATAMGFYTLELIVTRLDSGTVETVTPDGFDMLEPFVVSSTSATQTSFRVGGTHSPTLEFVTVVPLSTSETVEVEINDDWNIASVTSVDISINGGATTRPSFSKTGSTIILTDPFWESISTGSTITLTLWSLTNPFVGDHVLYARTVAENNGYTSVADFTIVVNEPCSIDYREIVTETPTISSTTRQGLKFLLGVAPAGIIEIVFPSSISLSHVACTLDDANAVCLTIGNTVTVYGVNSDQGKLLYLEYDEIVTPPNTAVTDFYILRSYDWSLNLYCESTTWGTFTALAGTVAVNEKLRSDAFVGSTTNFSLTFTIGDDIDAGSIITVRIPFDHITDSEGLTCESSLEGSSPQSIGFTKTVLDTEVVLTFTEWCSASDTECASCCSAGTQLGLDLLNVRNSLWANPNPAGFNITVEIPDQTAFIDIIYSDVDFEPSLLPKSFATVSAEKSGDTVGLNLEYELRFESTTQYTENSQFLLRFNEGAMFPSEDATEVVCTNTGDASASQETPQCTTVSLHSDGSINEVLVTEMCPDGDTSGAVYQFKLSNTENQAFVTDLDFDVYIEVQTAEGYPIETGVADETLLAALDPNAISDFTFTRTTDFVQAPISVDISFYHPTEIPSVGQIRIDFPAHLLVVDSTLQVTRQSDGQTLQTESTVVEDYYASISILDYCSAGCSKESTVAITIQGIQNHYSVVTFTGTIAVETNYLDNVIDTAEFDAASTVGVLHPGTMYDVEIHPFNPTVGVTTKYRVIFTPEHSIPSGSMVEVTLPAEVTVLTSSNQCDAYLTIESSIACTANGQTITATAGFSSDYTGSFMIGLWLNSLVNPSDASTLTGFQVTLLNSAGEVIDQSTTATAEIMVAETTCSDTCAFCAGDSDTCYSCDVPSSTPLLQDYSCQSECPDGYFYVASDHSCIKCHYTCGSCLSEKASECTSCAAGLYQSDGNCVSSCPADTTTIGAVCQNTLSCASECDTCSTSSDYCLTCPADPAVLYAEGGECVESGDASSHNCPSGCFELDEVCQECFYECADCVGSETTCTACSSLYNKEYLNTLTSECVEQCPADVTVQVETSKTCEPCPTFCATCSALDVCVTCLEDYYMTPDDQCVSECGADLYSYTDPSGVLMCISDCFSDHFVDTANECTPCLEDCLTCSDGATCDTCDGDLYWTSDGDCVDSCDPTYYLHTADGAKECYASECPEGYLTYTTDAGVNECIPTEDCVFEAYFVTDSACLPCGDGCEVCVSATDCTTCYDPYLNSGGYCVEGCEDHKYRDGSDCVEQCSAGTYHYSDPETDAKMCRTECDDGFYSETIGDALYCYDCFETCATCDGGDATDCIECEDAFPLSVPSTGECTADCGTDLYKSESSCVENCPDGEFKYTSDTEGNICIESCDVGFFSVGSVCDDCNANCLTCEGSADTCTTCDNAYLTEEASCASTCTGVTYTDAGVDYCYSACPNGTFLLDTTCLDECPESYYAEDSECNECDASCLECSGPEETDCSECTASLLHFEGQCLSQCPDGYKPEGETCIPECSQSICNTCSSTDPDLCLTCADGYVLHESACSSDCPAGYYEQGSNCVACTSPCTECTSQDTCTVCSDELSLYEGDCVEECPESLESRFGKCQEPCESPCADCKDGQPTACTECEGDSPYLLGSTCYAECPDGYFAEDNTCEVCNSGCGMCNSQTDCTQCLEGLLLTSDGECVEECPEGYELKDTICEAVDNEEEGEESESKPAVFAVYVLLGETILAVALVVLSRLLRPEFLCTKASVQSLLTVVEFTERILLMAFLWVDQGPIVSLLVSVVGSFVIGSSMISCIFHILHFDSLVESSGVVEEFVESNKWSFRLVKLCSYLFGIHFVRILYSGFFGVSVATNGKMMAQVNGFRTPLERLCFYNFWMVNVPLCLHHILVLALYQVVSNSWQAALFGFVLNLGLGGLFIVDWYRGPWRS